MSIAPKKRARRTPDQLIKDLEAKIEQVKTRAAQRKAKKDPTLRHISGAIRAIDKALAQSADATTKEALSEARSSLSAVLTLSGVVTPAGSRAKTAPAKAGPKIAPDKVLGYVQKHPGGLAKDIAEALGSDPAGIRPALQELKEGKRVKTQGKARGMRYFSVGK